MKYTTLSSFSYAMIGTLLACFASTRLGSVHSFQMFHPGMMRIRTTTSTTNNINNNYSSSNYNKKKCLTICDAKSKKKRKSQKMTGIDVDYFNPSRNIDMDHVHDCAEHYGKCSIQELEDMRTALHTERIQHQSSGFQQEFAEELDHRLLEEDLTFQLALLKDEMHTLPRWSSPHFMNDGKPSFSPPSSMIEPQQQQQQQTQGGGGIVTGTSSSAAVIAPPPSSTSSSTTKPPVKSFIQRSEEMFLIPNGLAEVAAFGMALLYLSLISYFNH